MDHIHLYEEPEFDAETQERLDSQVDRLLKGYDWTLAPLANKSVLPRHHSVSSLLSILQSRTKLPLKQFQKLRKSPGDPCHIHFIPLVVSFQ